MFFTVVLLYYKKQYFIATKRPLAANCSEFTQYRSCILFTKGVINGQCTLNYAQPVFFMVVILFH